MLSLFTTKFAAYTGGTWFSLMEACLIKLIWNGLHGRFIMLTCSDQIYKDIFHVHVYAVLETQVVSLKNYCSFYMKLYSCVWRYQIHPQILAAICMHGYLWLFLGSGHKKNISRFYLIFSMNTKHVLHLWFQSSIYILCLLLLFLYAISCYVCPSSNNNSLY